MIETATLYKELTSIINNARTVQVSAKMLEERADKLKKKLSGDSSPESKNLTEKQIARILAKKRKYTL